MWEKIIKLLFLLTFLLFVVGCVSISDETKKSNRQFLFNTSKNENIKDATTALKSVSEAITGKELTEDQAKKIVVDIRTNKETRTAVKYITDSLKGKKVNVKYCPVDGKRYSPDMKYCPGTDIRLVPVR